MPAARSQQVTIPQALRVALPAWTPAGLIIVLTLLAYSPAMSAGFIWDDDAYITLNPALKDIDGLRRIWIPRETPQYYPLVFVTFWIEHKLWGFQPAGYHIVNILLHAANALMVWRLCAVIKVPGGAAAAWLVGAAFALHPVHVESVAWITERKNVLSGFFYLAAALAYLRFDASNPTPASNSDRQSVAFRRWRWFVIALALFACALLSKTVTCTLPAALVLMMLHRRIRLTPARVAPLAPFFILGITMGLFTAILEREHVGATGEDFTFCVADRFIIASRALMFYPTKIIGPWPLVFIYPRWVINDDSLLSYVWVVIAAIVLAGLFVLYRRGWRGSALAAWFYAGTIFPALGFFNVYPMAYSFVADHFQYLPSLGIIVLIIGGAAYWIKSPIYILASAGVILPILLTLSAVQATHYRDPVALWQHTLAHNETSWMAHNNLSTALLRQAADLKASGMQDQATVVLASGFDHLCRAMDLHAKLRVALTQKDPNLLKLYAAYLARNGRLADAAVHFQSYVARIADDAPAQAMLGDALAKLERHNEAVAAFQTALSIEPRGANSSKYKEQLAHALRASAEAHARSGRFDPALSLSAQALALYRERMMLPEVRDMEDRINDYRSAMRRSPS